MQTKFVMGALLSGLLVSSTAVAQTRSQTSGEEPANPQTPAARASQESSDEAAEATDEAVEAADEAVEAQADADAAAAVADARASDAALDAQVLDAETETRVQELEAEIAQRRQEAATALGAAQQARQSAESSKEDAESASEAAVEAEKAAREAECQLTELQGEECINPEDEGVWVGYLDIGGSFSLNSTANVPGEARGTSVNGNVKLSVVLDYIVGKHEWRNSLQWDIGATRAASDEVWVKSIDRFVISSGYYYSVTPWFGPFVELELQTNFFPLDIRRGEDVTFCEGDFEAGSCSADVSKGEVNELTDSFTATNAFAPVTLDERAGLFIQLVDRTYFQWIARGGLGAQQFFVDDSSYLETGSGDDYVELGLLDKYGLVGVMADTEIMGAANEGMVQYGARAAMLYPFIDTNSDQLEAQDINPIQVDLGAFVHFTVADWLGFRVSGEGYRQPQVTGDKWQTRINFLATFSYSVFGDRDAARDANSSLKYGDLVGADGDVAFKN